MSDTFVYFAVKTYLPYVMTLKKTIIIAAMSVILAIRAYSGENERHFEAIPGAYNHLMTALHRHSDGLIWIGTSTGLCRYDGYSIRPAYTIQADSATIIDEYILKITEDADGRLWLKTQSGYAVYDPASHRVWDDISAVTGTEGISGKVLEVADSPDGSLWIASDNGLYNLPKAGGKARKAEGYPTADINITSIVAKEGLAVCADESGTITVIDANSMKPTLHTSAPGLSGPRRDYQLTVDSRNRYWLYCTFTVELYDADSKRWISQQIADRDCLGNIRMIYEDHDGSLWMARDHQGIARIQTDSDGIRIIQADIPGDITHRNTVTCFMEGPAGSRWLGTYKLGLLAHHDNVRKFGLETLPDVNCMLPTRDSRVWVGTDSEGLWVWNTDIGERKHIDDSTGSISPAAITSLAETRDGTLYIGAFADGLRRLKGGKIERLTTGTQLDRSFIWALTKDRNGKIWVSTLGAGVYLFDPDNESATSIGNADNGLQSQYVVTATASKDGRIYFGNSYGIAYYNPKDGLIHNLKDLDPNLDTDGWRLTQLIEDSRGLLWAATSNGLMAIDREHARITKIRTGDNSFHNYVAGIIEDNGGSLWVTEGRELINLRVNYNEKTGDIDVSTRTYDTDDGLMDCDFNQRSLAKLADGEILIGGLYGVNRFLPNDISLNKTHPKVIFTDLYVDGRLQHPQAGVEGLPAKGALTDGGLIELSPDTREFTIYFTTDNYALPEKTTYLYRLEGYSDEWRSIGPGQHSVTFSNLRPGKYRLMVKGINSDGYESDSPAQLNVRIKPPFWATGWAIAVYALLAALAIWGIVRLITKFERRRYERKIEEENRNKQEEINQLKFKFFTNVSHDLRTPLTLIVSPLEEMIKETSDPRQTQRLSLMKINATKLLTLVNQLLDFRKNEVAGLQLNASEGDAVAFSRNVCNSFSSLTERKNIALSFFSDHDSIHMLFDYDKLEKIFMNLLGNAVKFTPSGGRIDVSLEQVGSENPMLRIKVADTGIGIKDKDKEHIFERFYQVDDNGESHPHMGSGIGLSMVSEYVRLHDGSIRVTDNVDTGSVFIIDIPIRHGSQEKAGKEEDIIPASAPRPEEARPRASSGDLPAAPQSRPLALVVDDNPDMTDMLRFELDNDFEVVTAADGNEALAIMEERLPDVILTDLMMPGMDGIELCRRLKSDKRTVAIPLIIITAKHDLGVKIEGLTLGADDYITKPFNLDVLRLRMKRLIELTAKGATRTLVEPEPEAIKITPLDEKFIEKAMKYVSDNLDSSQLSVEDLSDHLGMSRVRLYKKIKQITGKTPIEFIRIIRLKRAAQLLRESQLNVSEVAYQTGFNNPKVFSKYFKEEFGILPSLYQEKEGSETNYTV